VGIRRRRSARARRTAHQADRDRHQLFTRPSLSHYIATRTELEQSAAAVFDMIDRRVITPSIGGRYALADAASAHRDLEARRTFGSVVFTPFSSETV
jgi:NADPH:quinone reductase-like Zn-dependent oxidoreductase